MYLVTINRYQDGTLQQVSYSETKVWRRIGDAIASFVFTWAYLGPIGYRQDTGDVYVTVNGKDYVVGQIKPVRVVEGATHL